MQANADVTAGFLKNYIECAGYDESVKRMLPGTSIMNRTRSYRKAENSARSPQCASLVCFSSVLL